MEDKGAVKGTQTSLLCIVSKISQEVTASDWHRGRSSVRSEIRFRPIRPLFSNPVLVPVPAVNWPDRPD